MDAHRPRRCEHRWYGAPSGRTLHHELRSSLRLGMSHPFITRTWESQTREDDPLGQ